MKPAEFPSSLELLNRAVAEAVEFFAQADENLCAGEQTARQCLSHLVFWHREYLSILRALAEGRTADLREATFTSLNAEAGREFAPMRLPDLASQMESLQRELDAQLRAWPDQQVEIPLKRAGHPWPLADLVPRVAGHIQGHTKKFRSAQKRHQKAPESKRAAKEGCR